MITLRRLQPSGIVKDPDVGFPTLIDNILIRTFMEPRVKEAIGWIGVAYRTGSGPSAAEEKEKVDPTLLSTKEEGNASEKRRMAFQPVQCIGTTTSGAIAFNASMVSPMIGSKSGPAR